MPLLSTFTSTKPLKRNGRILHLAINEKFIDHAHISFENVASGQNDYFIFFDEHTSQVKCTPHTKVRYRDRLGWNLYRKIAAYDFVVVHCLHPFWISVINACPDSVVFVWIGWGADYYDIIFSDQNAMLLDATRRDKLTHLQIPAMQKKFHLATSIRRLLEAVRLSDSKYAAITKMTLFAPVIPDEYGIVKNSFAGDLFPAEASWNYGSLEEVLIKEFTDKATTGNNILLGNSASYTSNHLDAIEWLSTQESRLSDRQVICPLSYGDLEYGRRVKEFGRQHLGERFTALMDFITLPEYVRKIQSCSHMIMNHKRQQGVGNIIIMLYLGATVFLREESLSFQYFRRLGFHIFSVQEMERQPLLLKRQLNASQKQDNMKRLHGIWSKSAIDQKTKKLIEVASSYANDDREKNSR